jgi:hypothetical protein
MMALFKRKKRLSADGDGLVLFADVQEALKAEKVLKETGHWVNLVAPPPELRRGCDLAVEIHLTEQPGIERVFAEKDVAYTEVVPLKGGCSELLDIVQLTDFGDWVMVKAGNMKLTFEKDSGVIVNTSGGGCPDIPVMHAELLGKTVVDAPKPKDIGFTLCALMLHRALEESIDLCKGDEQQ